MTLFVADKIMWDQGIKPPFYDIVNDSLNHSLEKACLAYIDYVMDNGMILKPHPSLIDTKIWINDN